MAGLIAETGWLKIGEGSKGGDGEEGEVSGSASGADSAAAPFK